MHQELFAEDPPRNTETVTPPELPTRKGTPIDPGLPKLAFAFGRYLNSLPSAKHMHQRPAKWCTSRFQMPRKF